MSEPRVTGQLPGKSKSNLSFYWQYYGLTRDPFSAVRDDSMYFSLPKWEHHLDLLQHLIKSENVLLAVIGSEGSGKSTIAHQFMHQIGDAMRIHHFEADSLFSTRKLVRELEHGFNLKAPANEGPEEQLDSQIAEVQYSDKTCLLIIDDAHYLPLETLNSLLFLLKQQSTNQMRLHILLFGDKNLQTKLVNLAKHELSGELIHSIELEALSLEEARQYLQYRLNKAGLVGPMPLSQMSIEQIFSASQGCPDQINRFAQQGLLDDLAKQRAIANPSFMQKHQTKVVGGLLMVVVLVAAAYILNREGQHTANKAKPVIAFADQSQKINLPKPKQVKPNQVKPVNVAVLHPDVLKPVAPKVERQPIPAKATIPNIAPEAQALAQAQIHLNNLHLAKLEHISAVPKPEVKHIDIISHPDLGKDFAAKAKQPAKQAVKSTKVTKTTANHMQLTAIEKAIMKTNPKYYTLQVIGLSYSSSMKHFIDSYHLQKDTQSYGTTLRGKPWYVLIYGKYPTKAAAQEAIENLPKPLQKYKAWPRSYASVQEDIKKIM